MRRYLLLLPLVLLTGCGLGSRVSLEDAATKANILCEKRVRSVTAVAKAWGKTEGLVVVCLSGKVVSIH